MVFESMEKLSARATGCVNKGNIDSDDHQRVGIKAVTEAERAAAYGGVTEQK
jgi:hypothetical protein